MQLWHVSRNEANNFYKLFAVEMSNNILEERKLVILYKMYAIGVVSSSSVFEEGKILTFISCVLSCYHMYHISGREDINFYICVLSCYMYHISGKEDSQFYKQCAIILVEEMVNFISYMCSVVLG